MSVYKQKGSKNWWYKFTWHGRQIRESTKQPNERVAEQIEAAHKVSPAKAELAFVRRSRCRRLRESIDNDFAPFVESRFANKPKTRIIPERESRTCESSIRWPVAARCDHRRQDRRVHR